MRDPGDPKRIVRWADAKSSARSDATLGRVFRLVPDAEPLSPAALARVRQRMDRRHGSGARRTAFQISLAAVTAMLLGAGVAVAGVGAWSFLKPPAEPAPIVTAAVASGSARVAGTQRVRKRHVGASSATVPEPVAPPKEPVREGTIPLAVPVAPPAPTSAAARAPLATAAATATATAPSPRASDSASLLSRESEFLERAIIRLRHHADARGALSELDRYDAAFPNGTLAREARVTRIDALLRARERTRALELLRAMALGRMGRDLELRVVRAELLAERESANALTEFDALLAAELEPSLAERALYGRAGCRLALGDETGGRADLERYQRSFPNGRFREQVRARLSAP